MMTREEKLQILRKEEHDDLQQYDDDIMLTTTIMTYDKAIAKVLLL